MGNSLQFKKVFFVRDRRRLKFYDDRSSCYPPQRESLPIIDRTTFQSGIPKF